MAFAETFRKAIEDRTVQKTYVARVLGVFPAVRMLLIRLDSRAQGFGLRSRPRRARPPAQGTVETDAALKADPRAGSTVVAALADGGKEARTRFTRLSVAPDHRTSVVQCEPLTGRTHQVRTLSGGAYDREGVLSPHCTETTPLGSHGCVCCPAEWSVSLIFQVSQLQTRAGVRQP
jgi:23S rRNA-/tRNA-specific pseudouridylate synthase